MIVDPEDVHVVRRAQIERMMPDVGTHVERFPPPDCLRGNRLRKYVPLRQREASEVGHGPKLTRADSIAENDFVSPRLAPAKLLTKLLGRHVGRQIEIEFAWPLNCPRRVVSDRC